MNRDKTPPNYTTMLKVELLELAKSLGLTRLSRLRKDEIIDAIKRAATRRSPELRGPAPRVAKKGQVPARGRGLSDDRERPAAPASAVDPSSRQGRSSSKATLSSSKPAAQKSSPGARSAPAPSKALPTPDPSEGPAVSKADEKPVAKAARARGLAEVASAPSHGPSAPGAKDSGAAPSSQTARAASNAHRPRTARAIESPAASTAQAGEDKSEELRHLDQDLPELSERTEEDRLVLMPRDPAWLFAYWDLSRSSKEAARGQGSAMLVLRLLDVTGREGDAPKAHAQVDHLVSEWARSWYLPVPSPGREYMAEIGYKGKDHFSVICRSNRVLVPHDEPAQELATETATIRPEDDLDRMEPALPSPSEPAAPPPSLPVSHRLVSDDQMHMVVDSFPAGQPGSLGFADQSPPSPPSPPPRLLSLSDLAGSLGHEAGSLGHAAGSLGHAAGSLGHAAGSLGYLPGSLGSRVMGSASNGATGEAPRLILGAKGRGHGARAARSPADAAQDSEGSEPPLLEATVEMVIAGRSYPGTTLTVAGRTVPCGPDGAFSLRISVPEGTREIPIEACRVETGERRCLHLHLGRTVE